MGIFIFGFMTGTIITGMLAGFIYEKKLNMKSNTNWDNLMKRQAEINKTLQAHINKIKKKN